MSQKTEWEVHRQRGKAIRKAVLAMAGKSDTEVAATVGRLLIMGYTAEEIQEQIERIQNE